MAGLFAHTRNPMYVGNLLIAIGVSIFYGSLWMYVVIIPFFIWVYLAITAAEEQYLLGKFGSDYTDYMKNVNRFVPDFRGLSKSLAGFRYQWRTVLAKEYSTLFASLAGLTIIAMWKNPSLWLGYAKARNHGGGRASRVLVPGRHCCAHPEKDGPAEGTGGTGGFFLKLGKA